MAEENPNAPAGRALHLQTRMLHDGYDPHRSEGSVKVPIFETSTWAFKTAEEGKHFFEVMCGKKPHEEGESLPLAYSRINNPDVEIAEIRLLPLDGASACAILSSGTAAVTASLFSCLEPGDVLLHSEPLYGGTDTIIKRLLPKYLHIQPIGFSPHDSQDEILTKVSHAARHHSWKRIGGIFIETPCNPTLEHVDIALCARLRDAIVEMQQHRPVLIVDNTFLPMYQRPIEHGADMVVYSITKYISGNSRITAGACLGSKASIQTVKMFRGAFFGSITDPETAVRILDSVETLEMRMKAHVANARLIAQFLRGHPKVERVYYPEFLEPESQQYKIYKRQCDAPGGMISFDIKGGVQEAFKFLNSLQIVALAVSLGASESLAQNPFHHTHQGVDEKTKLEIGIRENMIRLSVGFESPDDIIWDLGQALERV